MKKLEEKRKEKLKKVSLDGARTLDLWLSVPVLYHLGYSANWYKKPHHRTIYSHMDFSIAIFTKTWIILGLGTRWLFYPLGYTFKLHWQTWGRVRSWKYSHFTTRSIIERFSKKCSLRSTVQAGPILFYQVIGRLPRYVMLKYFWNRKSLFLLTFWTFWSLPEHCAIFVNV